jgi:hypothetical protein
LAGGCPRNLPNFIKGLSAIFLREIARIELMLICYRWASEGTPSHALASGASETSPLYGDAALSRSSSKFLQAHNERSENLLHPLK